MLFKDIVDAKRYAFLTVPMTGVMPFTKAAALL